MYETRFVTSDTVVTETSTLVVTKAPETRQEKPTARIETSTSTSASQSSTSAAAKLTPAPDPPKSNSVPASGSASLTPLTSGPAQNSELPALAKSKSTPVAAVVGGVLGAALLAILTVAFWFWRRHSRAKQINSNGPLPTYRVSDLEPVGRVEDDEEKTMPELSKTSVARNVNPVPSSDARYELGPNMVDGPRYEMPGGENWGERGR